METPPKISETALGVFSVPSSSSDRQYTVMRDPNIGAFRCECTGYQMRSWCNHCDQVRLIVYQRKEPMSIKKEFIVHLKGKDYPIWAGVLDAATKAGLKSLTTKAVQIPDAANGHLAVVMARAEFDDGRVFEDVGDCSPQSTSPHLAAAALRLASTRAKGRCLRDAINVGQTMFEELPDEDRPTPVWSPGKRGQEDRPSDADLKAPPQAAGEGTQTICSDCQCDMTPLQIKVSINAYGLPLCPRCQRKYPRKDEK